MKLQHDVILTRFWNRNSKTLFMIALAATRKMLLYSVHPEIVDFGLRQGRRIFSTAGVVRLRRGSKKFENAVLGRKMLFLDGH